MEEESKEDAGGTNFKPAEANKNKPNRNMSDSSDSSFGDGSCLEKKFQKENSEAIMKKSVQSLALSSNPSAKLAMSNNSVQQ